MKSLVVLGLLTASTHWLVARSEIARPIWSRAHGWIGKLLSCAGCSGWWLGLGYGALGLRPVSHGWRGVLIAGVLGTILTPIFESCLIWGLRNSTILDDVVDSDPEMEKTTTPEETPRSRTASSNL